MLMTALNDRELASMQHSEIQGIKVICLMEYLLRNNIRAIWKQDSKFQTS